MIFNFDEIGKLYCLQNCPYTYLCYHSLQFIQNWEARSMNMSSLQGIVSPAIECSYPNSSSAILSSSWNAGSFKYDTGTT